MSIYSFNSFLKGLATQERSYALCCSELLLLFFMDRLFIYQWCFLAEAFAESPNHVQQTQTQAICFRKSYSAFLTDCTRVHLKVVIAQFFSDIYYVSIRRNYLFFFFSLKGIYYMPVVYFLSLPFSQTHYISIENNQRTFKLYNLVHSNLIFKYLYSYLYEALIRSTQNPH